MHDITLALHVGAPFTDNDLLVWSLRKDVQRLLDCGVLVRRPGIYKAAVNRLIQKHASDVVTDAEKEALLAGLMKGQNASRLVLSDAGTLGVPAWMLNGGRLFQNAGRNSAEVRELFPANRCEFFLGIRNPATLIPEAFASQSEKTWDEFLSGADLFGLRWSEVVRDILDDSPGLPVIVWCNEETPLIWPRILGGLAGLDASFQFSGELDMIANIMSEQGVRRLADYLAERPHFTERQKAQVKTVFLEKLYSEDAVEVEIDLPGWSQEVIDRMTEAYQEDVEAIRKIPGVRFIA